MNLDPALEVRAISSKLNHTRDITTRNELLVQLSQVKHMTQTTIYGTLDPKECVIYYKARKNHEPLSQACEEQDCNGLKTSCSRYVPLRKTCRL